MPYMLVSTQTRLETGPTFIGDTASVDDDLMKAVDAVPRQELGQIFKEFVSPHTPLRVLNTLEALGWRVVAMAGIGQTCAWTLHKP